MGKIIDKQIGEVLVQPTNAFSYQKKFEGEKDFDKYFIDRVIKQVARKIGPGDEDYVIEDKVIETKRDIDEVINADANNAGIEAYLAPYIQSKEPLPDVKVTDSVNDYTKCPDNLAEAIMLGEHARKAFDSLDPKLTKGMTYKEFMEGFKEQMFQDYIKSLAPKEPEKPKEGDK